MSSFIFQQHTKSSFCCSWMWAHPLELGQLPVAVTIKNTDSSNSQKPSTVPPLIMSPFLHHANNDWLDLIIQILCISAPAQKTLPLQSPSDLWVSQSFHPSSTMVLERWRGSGGWYGCLIWSWALHSPTFSLCAFIRVYMPNTFLTS